MPTAKTLRDLAEQSRTEAARLREQADTLEQQAVELDAMAERLEQPRLTISHSRSIISSGMQPSEYVAEARLPGRKPESDHPFPLALRKHKPPLTLRQWAAAHGLKRGRVQSWILEGDGGRRIPRKYADEIAKDFGVPATLKSWPNGIRED